MNTWTLGAELSGIYGTEHRGEFTEVEEQAEASVRRRIKDGRDGGTSVKRTDQGGSRILG